MPPFRLRRNRLLKVLLVGYGPVALALGERLVAMPEVLFLGQVSSQADETMKWTQYLVPSVNHFEFTRLLAGLQPDLVLVASWGERFSQAVLNRPQTAFINCHGSLLPRHRGPNPYAATLLCGDIQAGVTFHWMDLGFDSGPIALQQAFDLSPESTGGSLQRQAAQLAQALLPQLLQGLRLGTLPRIPQDESLASYQAMPETVACVRWSSSPEVILRQVRAISPWFRPYSHLLGFQVAFSEITLLSKPCKRSPGTIQASRFPWLEVATGDPSRMMRVCIQTNRGLKGLLLMWWLRLALRPGLRFDSLL